MLNNTDITKVNGAALGVLAVLVMAMGGLSGCSNTVAKKNLAAKPAVVKSRSSVKQQLVVINQPKTTAGSSAKRDQHHVEHDKKRMWYNQQWLVKQDVGEKQRVARQKYQQQYEQTKVARQQQEQQVTRQQYHQRYQQQQQKQQALVAARQQQQAWHQNKWQAQQVRSQQNARHQRASLVQRPRGYTANPNLAQHLSSAAIARTYQKVRYDGRYIPISYPMGDVPANIGVCTDTVIRSYRRLGIDLQRLVHEDISQAFYAYPNLPKWGLAKPDPNIDHRRVHNLKIFFARNGQRLPVTRNPADYRPGDLVTWYLGGDQEHIGLVVNHRSPEDPNRYMIVHNIAKGDRMEDILFKLPISGHYRYLPTRQPWLASAQ